ncbi:MAG: glycosyltransferase family 2 protein, partial [Alphaproteobacteria bacterium]|nr:glycosyltransferase family 2 protein [Alphaproteobacteria bacterium]
MKVSVVINTYNRAEYLDRALQSLYYQEYPDFEVIVVNGPSTDNTEEIMQKYAQDIKIGHCSEANLAISRNIGIAMASGDYVAFMDDDAVPEPEWLNVLLSGFT